MRGVPIAYSTVTLMGRVDANVCLVSLYHGPYHLQFALRCPRICLAESKFCGT